MENVVKHWKRLPRKGMELPFLEIFRRHTEMTPGDMFNGGLGYAVLVDSMILKVFSQFRDSV